MNWADWVIVVILGLSVAISVIRGFVREALSLVVWGLAFVGAMVFHQEAAGYFADIVDTPSLRTLVAWVVVFFAVLIVGSLLVFLISQLVESTGLSGTDRFLGSLFGAARGFIVVMVILIVLPGILPVSQDTWWRESVLIPYFLACQEWVMSVGADLLAYLKSFF